jgi:hypothetical protein
MESQTDKLYKLLADGKPYRTDQIVSMVYGNGLSLARVGARIFDVKRKYRIMIKGWKDKDNPALYWYQRYFPHEVLDHKTLRDDDVERVFRETVGRLKMFDLESIEFINAYKAWQKAKPQDRDRCRGAFVYLYNRLNV